MMYTQQPRVSDNSPPQPPDVNLTPPTELRLAQMSNESKILESPYRYLQAQSSNNNVYIMNQTGLSGSYDCVSDTTCMRYPNRVPSQNGNISTLAPIQQQQYPPQIHHNTANSTNGLYSLPYQLPFQPMYLGMPQQPIPIPTSNQNSSSYASMSYPGLGESPPIVSSLNQVGSPIATGGSPTQVRSKILSKEDVPLARRTKVSWACDKCRRRKTRCDMDENHSTCTPCARAGVPCTFLRAQLRRGPSKKRNNSGTNSSQSSNISGSPNQTRRRSRSDPVSEIIRPVHFGRSGSPLNTSSSDKNQLSPSSSNEKQSGLPALIEAAYRESQPPEQRPAEPKVASEIVLGKPRTPPRIDDDNIMGISHELLVQYYKKVHPMFPLLPDRICDLAVLLDQAGPAKLNLITSLKAVIFDVSGTAESENDNALQTEAPSDLTLRPSVSPETMSIALGKLSTKDSLNTSDIQEAHLIALLLTYMHTLDAAWIGAAVAAATALVSSRTSVRTCQLVALLVVLDKLHCAVNRTLSLVPDSLLRYAERSDRIRPTLALFSFSSDHNRGTPQQEVMREMGRLALGTITLQEAIGSLNAYTTEIKQTPLQNFVEQLVQSTPTSSF